MPNLSQHNVNAAITKARVEGAKAAKVKLAELEQAGPVWNVIQHSNPLDDSSPGRVVGQLLDVCGFASIILPYDGRSRIIKILNQFAEDPNHRIYMYKHYYRKAWVLSIHDMYRGQEMSVNAAACQGAIKALQEYGVSGSVETRID